MHYAGGVGLATGGHIVFDGDDLTRLNDNRSPCCVVIRSDHLPKLQPAADVHRGTEHPHAAYLGR